MSRITLVVLLVAGGCFNQVHVPEEASGAGGSAGGAGSGGGAGAAGAQAAGRPSGASAADAIAYRDDLAMHPGCTTDGLMYPAGQLTGYRCAVKAYPFPAGKSEDTTRPVVLLVHGNSDAPSSWERFPADSGAEMLSERLVASGLRTYAVDLRIDRTDRVDCTDNNDTCNAARNIEHGWAVPIVMHLVEASLAAFPGRRVSLVGFSLGSTVIRDALRRLHFKGALPWERGEDVVLLAGANHGVSTYARLCGRNPTMRGEVACQMGARDNFSPTEFMKALNGASGAFEAPCADGRTAFGQEGYCGGRAVSYTTVVMKDIMDGSFQDEFVSEKSTFLGGADNRKIELTDFDESGYFFNGLLKNHYGAARSAAALGIVLERLMDGR